MAFATYSDLEARLGRTLSSTERTQVAALLDDATEALIADCLGGNRVVQGGPVTAVFNVPVGERTITLPQQPVRSVTAVLVDNAAVSGWVLRGGKLVLPYPVRPQEWTGQQPTLVDSVDITVTWTYGLPAVPGELKAWCLVLAAQAFASITGPAGTLAPGPVQQVRIDDFSTTYATGGDAAAAPGLTVPDAVRERLASRWGANAFVVGSAP